MRSNEYRWKELGVWVTLLCILLYPSISSSGAVTDTATTTTTGKVCAPIGDDPTAAVRHDRDDAAESVIVRYLSSHNDHDHARPRFHVQGWRWHTMSLVRDMRRLERLALRLSASAESERSVLDPAARHVVDFNMRGLHRIENDVFFPWLRTRLAEEAGRSSSVPGDGGRLGDALVDMIDWIDAERRSVSALGTAVTEQARIASSSSHDGTTAAHYSPTQRTEALANVARLSAALGSRTRGIQDREERLLVPSVAALIPEREQRSLNSRVLRNLGLADSRTHLVGMHDAVAETDDDAERERFLEYIPYLPRALIPRWRRTLYEPRAGALEDVVGGGGGGGWNRK